MSPQAAHSAVTLIRSRGRAAKPALALGCCLVVAAVVCAGCDDSAGVQGKKTADVTAGLTVDVALDVGAGPDGGASETKAQCAVDADCASLEDGDACNGTLRCDTSGATARCVPAPNTVVQCATSKTVCSVNRCVPQTGACELVAVADGTPCVDDNACSVDSACKSGSCAAGDASWCPCESDADCPASDNLCAGVRYCDKGAFPYQCRVNISSVVACGDGKKDLCKVSACVPATGKCESTPVERVGELCVKDAGCVSVALAATEPDAEAVSCDDGDECTVDDVCAKGKCAGESGICICTSDADCAPKEDGNLCTGVLYCDVKSGSCLTNPKTVITCAKVGDTACVKNTCNPLTGACAPAAVASASPCDDGDVCTSGDFCLLGVCKPGTQTCPCKSDAECVGKDNGDKCDGVPFCDKSKGQCLTNPATKIVCQTKLDTNCLKAACDKSDGACPTKAGELSAIELTELVCDLPEGKCRRVKLPQGSPPNQGAACNDGDSCTVGEVCEGGQCKGGQNTCGCKTDGDCASQEDGDLCNGTLFCNLQKGLCQLNPKTAVTCASVDDTECIKNTCQSKTGKCAPQTVINGSACTDGNPCTKSNFCVNGACTGGTFVCACAVDSDCLNQDDGDLCNGVPYCDKTVANKPVCKPNPSSAIFCSKGEDSACAKAQCDPKTGKCALKPQKSGVSCDDGDACTEEDTCKTGACAGVELSCDDGSECTKDVCDAKLGCQHTPATCDDGNSCTVNLCDAKTGKCSFDAKAMLGKTCDGDGDGCTLGDACVIGQGGGVCKTGQPVVCGLPVKQCQKAVCVSLGGQSFQCVVNATADSAGCDDGELCTVGDRCLGGACKAGEGQHYFSVALPGPATEASAQAVAHLPGGDVLVAGAFWQPGSKAPAGWMVTKTDPAGAPIWSRAMSSPSTLQGLGVVAAWPGGQGAVVVAGTFDVPKDKGGGLTARVLTLTADGSKAYSDRRWGPVAALRSARTDGLGGAWLVGERMVKQQRHAFLVHLSADGIPVLATDVVTTDVVRAAGHDLRLGGGHHLAIQGKAGPRALRLSATGEVVWQRVLNELSDAKAVATLTSGLAVVGSKTIAGAPTAAVQRLDEAGQPLWSRVFAAGGELRAVVASADGGVVAAGLRGTLAKPAAQLIGLGVLGATVWEQQLPGTNQGPLDALALTTDGELLSAGAAAVGKAGATRTRPLVARLSAWGQLSCSLAGGCVAKSAAHCDDKNPCTNDLCGGKAGCVHLSNAVACDDGDQCTAGDVCAGGKCKPKAAVSCPDDGPCAVTTCLSSLGCVTKAKSVGASCDDGDICTSGDGCDAKQACVGVAKSCDDGVSCTADSCDAKKGCVTTVNHKACGDNNVCTDDTCDTKKGCLHAANSASCGDGKACTVGAACKNGVCQAGTPGKLWSVAVGVKVGGSSSASGQSGAADVALAPSGGVYVAGFQRATNDDAKTDQTRALRLDALGKVVWDKQVGGAHLGKGGAERLTAVVADQVGAVFVGHGTTASKGSEDGLAVGLKADGSQRFFYRYGGTYSDTLAAAMGHADGSVTMVGRTHSLGDTNGDGWFLQISPLGFQTTSVAVRDLSDTKLKTREQLHAVVARNGGGFIVAGDSLNVSWSKSKSPTWVAALDAQGKPLWHRQVVHDEILNFNRHLSARRLVALADGSVAVAVWRDHETFQNTTPFGAFEVWRYDADGTRLWQHRFDTAAWPAHGAPLGVGFITAIGGEIAVGGFAAPDQPTRRGVVHRLSVDRGEAVFSAFVDAKLTGASSPLYRTEVRAGVAAADGLFVAGYQAASRQLIVARLDPWASADCQSSGACADKGVAGCDDDNPCTDETCSAGTCAPKPVAARACAGDAFCTSTSACDPAGACKPKRAKLYQRAEVLGKPTSSKAPTAEELHHVIALSSGEALAVGTYYSGGFRSGAVMHLDPGGDPRWAAALVAPKIDSPLQVFRAVTERAAGGYLLVGERRTQSNKAKAYGVIEQIDSHGGVTHTKLLATTRSSQNSYEFGLRAAVKVSDSLHVVGGIGDPKAKNSREWLLGWDAAKHEVLWQTYRAGATGAVFGLTVTTNKAVVAATDGGYVAWLSDKGVAIAQTPLTVNVTQHGAAIDKTGDGGVVVAGYAGQNTVHSYRRGFVARLSSDRKVQWSKAFNLAGQDELSAVRWLPDGRIAAVGFGTVTGKKKDGRLLILTGAGVTILDHFVGGKGDEVLNGLTVLSDGGLLAVGTQGSSSTSKSYLARFSPWGHSACVTAGFCADTPLGKCDDKDPSTVDGCSAGKGCTH